MNRESIIKQCREAGACKEELARLVNAETDEEFNQILADNIVWIAQKQIKIDFNEVFSLCKFNGNNWCLFIETYPQFHEYCKWEKLDGDNWCWLLVDQPQFAKHCNWNKLNEENWNTLLKKQPQFILHRERV